VPCAGRFMCYVVCAFMLSERVVVIRSFTK
jgi:hypothetical protein